METMRMGELQKANKKMENYWPDKRENILLFPWAKKSMVSEF